MASSGSILSVPINRCHVRSTSLPSSSHPISQRVEENLNHLKQQWESSPSPSASSSSLCIGLSGLTQLYESLEDLLQLTQTHQAFSRHGQHEKCIHEVLDGSLRLLDACGTARDVTMEMIDALKDLQLSLRRRRVESITTYVSLRKKAVKCLKALKKSEVACEPSTPSDSEVINVLREARSISITILESLLSFISITMPRLARRSFFVKWVGSGSGRIACEGDGEKVNEMEKLDASLKALNHHKSQKEIKQLDVDNAQEQLKATLVCMEGLEEALDLLQRRLIQTRVSLLNLLSH